MNKTVQITVRAIVIKEFTETVSMPMGATQQDMEAFAQSLLEQVPSGEFEESAEAWRLESASTKLINEPAEGTPLRAAMDEQGRLCAYMVRTRREIAPPTKWPRGSTQIYWVTSIEKHPGGSGAFLMEVRDTEGKLLAERLVRGRHGLNLFYENMVGYKPDSDEYEQGLNNLRDRVLEMFYRHTTDDPN